MRDHGFCLALRLNTPGYSRASMGTWGMNRGKSAEGFSTDHLKEEGWRRWWWWWGATLGTVNAALRLPQLCKMGLWVNANRLSHTKTLRCFHKDFITEPSSLSLASLSPSGLLPLFPSCYLLTEMRFQEPKKEIGRGWGTCANLPANDSCPS